MGRRRNRDRSRSKTGDRFNLMPEWVLLHPDWKTAPAGALPLLIDMHRRWTGAEFNNNGSIGYGVRAAMSLCLAHRTACKLFAWLECHDWIRASDKNCHPFLPNGQRRQSEWQITYLPTDRRPSARRESTEKSLEAGRATEGGRRIKIDHRLLASPAYVSASPVAKALLIELIRRHDGGNNGSIAFGGKDGRRIGLGDDATWRALRQLSDRKLIIETQGADALNGGRRRWLLTMLPAPGARKPANDYLGWSDKNQIASSLNAVSDAGGVPQPRLAAPRRRAPALTRLGDKASVPAGEVAVAPDRDQGTRTARPNRDQEAHIESHPLPAPSARPDPPPSPEWTSAADPHSASALSSPDRPADTLKKSGASRGRNSGGRALGKIDAAGAAITHVIDGGAPLLGDAAPAGPSPREVLRLQLLSVFAAGSRGLQQQVADALNIDKSTFSNALAGRDKFSALAARLLSGWLNGEAMPAGWPALPPLNEAKTNAA